MEQLNNVSLTEISGGGWGGDLATSLAVIGGSSKLAVTAVVAGSVGLGAVASVGLVAGTIAIPFIVIDAIND